MWTGASPWSDLVQRALTWEAREPDVFVNVFFGFPWADVPDAGMTIQVQTNDDPELARRIAADMANWTWSKREALLNTTRTCSMKDGVAQAREFARAGKGPIVLADYSDRSGYATWLLREIVDQKLERTLIATIASKRAVDALSAAKAKPGDVFDMEVGGLMDNSAGVPVKIKGTIVLVKDAAKERQQGQQWYGVSFGKGNVLIVSPYLVQIIEADELWGLELKPEDFDVIAIKSRVHFRRGFDDNGYARQILLVEPDQPFLGTVHLEALSYENLRLTEFYPYGSPNFELRIHE